VSFPKRSEIFQDPIWKIKDTVAKPALDTFYQVDFSFSSNVDRWLNVEATAYDRQTTNLASGSKRLSGSTVKRKMMLLCSEAEIPGTSFQTTDAVGQHQGITEVFPTYRDFPPLNLSFYLDSEHVALELFESWMQYINPLQTPDKQKNAYSRFAYPETYKERLHITKYERDFKTGSKMSQYEFVNVFPTNLTSMRVNYGSSAVVKVSVQLAYDRFFTKFSVIDTNEMASAMPRKRSNNWWNKSDNYLKKMMVNSMRGQGNRNILTNSNRGGGGKRKWDGSWFGNLGK